MKGCWWGVGVGLGLEHLFHTRLRCEIKGDYANQTEDTHTKATVSLHAPTLALLMLLHASCPRVVRRGVLLEQVLPSIPGGVSLKVTVLWTLWESERHALPAWEAGDWEAQAPFSHVRHTSTAAGGQSTVP